MNNSSRHEGKMELKRKIRERRGKMHNEALKFAKARRQERQKKIGRRNDVHT